VRLAACWAHARRKFYDVQEATGSPIAAEALRRIGELYALKASIRGQSPDHRQQDRDQRSRPLVAAFKQFLDTDLSRIPSGSALADGIRCALARWPALSLFLDDGRIEIDSNIVERSIRPIATHRSLCNLSSSICKHWKRVIVSRVTRAAFSSDRGFYLFRIQVAGTDLIRRAGHNLLGRENAAFDQAADCVVRHTQSRRRFCHGQPFAVFFRRFVGGDAAHPANG
jgi:transposase